MEKIVKDLYYELKTIYNIDIDLENMSPYEAWQMHQIALLHVQKEINTLLLQGD